MEIPETTRELLLRRWPVARLATLGPEGPQLVPIVFAWHEERLWTPVDGKPKRERELARLRNLRVDPRVGVLLDHYDEDWSRLWWLRLEGSAEVADASDPRLEGAARALRAKYPQYRSVELFRDPPTALVVSVERTRSWCAGPEALERIAW
jgi:PPOX class probable F420-dependent enzyme